MRRVLTGAIAAVAVLGLAACSSGAGSTPTATTSANTQNAALISAAKDAATKIAGGQTIGGKVTLLGALGGDQLDQYLAAFKPFEEATGIKVEYEGTRDMLSVLQTRVQGGNPPDVVSNPSLGQMRQLIKDGKLLALNDVVDVEQVKKDYDSGLVELGSQNGTLYGLMQTSALKGMVYYNPEKYQVRPTRQTGTPSTRGPPSRQTPATPRGASASRTAPPAAGCPPTGSSSSS